MSLAFIGIFFILVWPVGLELSLKKLLYLSPKNHFEVVVKTSLENINK